MNQPLSNAELMEALASLEHEQWIHWSQAVAPGVTVETRQKWERSWVNYGELSEKLKEADRVWALKVVTLLREKKII